MFRFSMHLSSCRNTQFPLMRFMWFFWGVKCHHWKLVFGLMSEWQDQSLTKIFCVLWQPPQHAAVVVIPLRVQGSLSCLGFFAPNWSKLSAEIYKKKLIVLFLIPNSEIVILNKIYIIDRFEFIFPCTRATYQYTLMRFQQNLSD